MVQTSMDRMLLKWHLSYYPHARKRRQIPFRHVLQGVLAVLMPRPTPTRCDQLAPLAYKKITLTSSKDARQRIFDLGNPNSLRRHEELGC